jgi:hypothetical protein
MLDAASKVVTSVTKEKLNDRHWQFGVLILKRRVLFDDAVAKHSRKLLFQFRTMETPTGS